MGDGADLCLEQMDLEEERRLEYRTGNMSPKEAYEEGIIDELGFECDTSFYSRREMSKRKAGDFCPLCGNILVAKINKKLNTWFVGCSRFPHCRYSCSTDQKPIDNGIGNTDDNWRTAIEEALGLEPDPENHNLAWAKSVISAVRMIARERWTMSTPAVEEFKVAVEKAEQKYSSSDVGGFVDYLTLVMGEEGLVVVKVKK